VFLARIGALDLDRPAGDLPLPDRIGIGGIMAVTVGLTSDYCSQRYRATIIMMMFCGNPLGGFVGGQIVAQLLPIYGWQCIFVVGGAFPLLLLPILAIWLPESPALSDRARRPIRPRRRDPGRLNLTHSTGAQSVDVATGNP
jgi:AAHS family 4-hydroxybenzoate transporter-like MFS transporter